LQFDLSKPCPNCPFRKVGGIRVDPSRAEDIAHAAIDNPGQAFPCHLTVNYDLIDEESGAYEGQRGDQYCAGALNFAINNDRFNQIMRIAMRLDWWDPDKMKEMDKCFATVSDMVKAQPLRTAKRKLTNSARSSRKAGKSTMIR
jgi:hypothetical protein